VFVTSRSTTLIVNAFKGLEEKCIPYRHLLLDDKEFNKETEEDICKFLEAKFETIKKKRNIPNDPWPDDLHHLVSLATDPSPLFICAETLCQFVDDDTGREKPTDKLALWLEQCKSHTSQLNQIYALILYYVLFGSYKESEKPKPLNDKDRSQLLDVLSAIIVLATPLPAGCLTALLGIEKYDVNHWLNNLHAALNVPSDSKAPVQLRHKSFSDFLRGQEGTGMDSFHINAVEKHAMLASKCIDRMKRENGGL
jgi:hypothetical protein